MLADSRQRETKESVTKKSREIIYYCEAGDRTLLVTLLVIRMHLGTWSSFIIFLLAPSISKGGTSWVKPRRTIRVSIAC